jgi:hypothetical protein
VNGDSARTSSAMVHNFLGMVLRGGRALQMATSIYVFVRFAGRPNAFQLSDALRAPVRQGLDRADDRHI